MSKIRLAQLMKLFGVLSCGIALVACLSAAIVATVRPEPGSPQDTQPGLPVRAAFYYPWFPEAWKQQGIEPYTNYHPSLGFYSLSDQTMVRQHIDAMQYGGIQVGIASWWGQGSATDQRLPLLLTAAAPTTFRWSIYYEPESQGDPSLSTLSADLTYLRDHYGSDPSLLRIDGRLVVFVYADASDGCGMVERWTQANSVNAYLVLKVFAGYRSCARQPDGWHQYAPASAADAQDQFSYAISPGFYKVGENPRLARDLARWKSNIRDMIASGARFQLITTFNEWGEGTAVESAQEWASASGYGAYLDALHNNGQDNPVATPVATPAPTSPATILGGTTLTYIANADTRVEQAHPDINYGGSASLRVINGNTTNIESYLRFTVDNVSGTLQSAKLRVYATSNGTTNGPAVYATSNDWSETKITWNTRLARTSGAADNKGAIGTNSWVEYNVTPIVTGNGTYSFVLGADSTDGVLFASRETSTPPQLVLTLASTSNPTPTSQPSPAPTSNPTPTSQPSLPPTPTSTPPPSAASDPVLLAAGDIASCSSNGDEATAKLLDSLAGTVVTLGDNAYESGTAGEFTNCFHPTWGRSQARIRPAVGNHEYLTAGAAGYFGYFGAAAGDPRKGYYSYDLGTWHIIALNSNCSQVGGCGAGSPQEQWLRADLTAHASACTLAYWHHPRFSSGEHGSNTGVQPLWQALYDAGADLVLNGHDHDYERFSSQDPNGTADRVSGIREFVVGTGGKNHYAIGAPIANSEVRNDSTFGVLRLTLHPESYDWKFVPEAGASFSDSGSDACHAAPVSQP